VDNGMINAANGDLPKSFLGAERTIICLYPLSLRRLSEWAIVKKMRRIQLS
jgi:hypothetical protein